MQSTTTLPDDVTSLKSTIFSLQKELNQKQDELSTKEEKLNYYEQENDRLSEVIRLFKHRHFGKNSEKWQVEEQYLLFNEVEALVDGQEKDEKGIEVKGHTRKPRGKRSSLPEHLPRDIEVIDIPEEEKNCPKHGNSLKVIGEEVSEKLEYRPAELRVKRIVRLKYGCSGCDECIKEASAPPSIIPKGIATPSLLSQIVTSKFMDGLPLYRQERIFDRLKVDLHRNTMARWIVQVAEACIPIWNLLEEKLLERPYVSCDETKVQVLKEKGKKAESLSYMWVRAGPGPLGPKIVLFDYDPSRSQEVPKRLLADYKGYLQVDGYQAYNEICRSPDIVRLGCFMHARRRFFEATKASKKGSPLAEQGLSTIQTLYKIEEEIKDFSIEDIYKVRQEKSVPLLDELHDWSEKNSRKVPPKSTIGKAFSYLLDEWPYLTRYTEHGMLNIDNGLIERMIKYFAIGRKAWLFSDTVGGAEASSLFYSFVITAHVNNQKPNEVLMKIFEQLPYARTVDDYEALAQYLLGTNPVIN